ncbi:MAG: hypothetical protein LBF89_06355 [Bacteroidales bacterium]|nr:hypothetical protein [Bacteroidales bacterium]
MKKSDDVIMHKTCSFVLSGQRVKSDASIGAPVKESGHAQFKANFINKRNYQTFNQYCQNK